MRTPALFATTALISIVCLPALLTPASAAGHAFMPDGPDKFAYQDHNAKFLCDYGFGVASSTYQASSSSAAFWISAATPVPGHGRRVKEIIVAEAPLSGYSSYSFNVALYSDAAGKPGNEIAGALVSPANTGCHLVKVHISPIQLQNANYWIVESAPVQGKNRTETTAGAEWLYRAHQYEKQKALYRSGSISCNPSGCTKSHHGWTKIDTTDRPYAELK